ncbi:ferredoxin family protein [Leptolinea tardivitalis]|uniref:4Fe-4S dicluster domain-containing protein n=1 Tax=Leptolinea tardivitalis TaxID=229920 RepID=UPI0009D6B1D3|nr:ferredoxin family protein [Leptolinea tardivitalis]GAP20525.1 ferredoxin [Leptolinea tardivitalis]
MPHVITSLCLRDGGCATVCPVECIVPGKPTDKYPTFYIDPETCIDCDACVAECPWNAIFTEDEVPSAYTAKGGEYLSMPKGTPGFSEVFNGKNHDGDPVHLESTRKLTAGEVVDLTPAIEANASFFKDGPGYKAAG